MNAVTFDAKEIAIIVTAFLLAELDRFRDNETGQHELTEDVMRHQLEEWDGQAREAQAKAAQAYARLITLAEKTDSGQAGVIARFLASTYSSVFKLDLFDLRRLDANLADDVLACIDALRGGKSDLCNLVPDGDERIQRLIRDWGIKAGD